MDYEFYADIFFLTNLYLDYTAVYVAGEILQQKKNLCRYLLGCGFSSFIGCVLFLVLSNYKVYCLCIHFIVNPGMIVLCFFPAGRRIYCNAFFLMYLIMFLLGGTVEWLYRTLTNGRYYPLCILMTIIPVMVFLYILRRKRKKVCIFYQVQIIHHGKSVSVQALYDTGNHLWDPYVGKPVHIISDSIYKKLGGANTVSLRMIPFSSVGCKEGMLEAFGVERVEIETEKEAIVIAPAILAVADKGLFYHHPYQMILNSSISEK